MGFWLAKKFYELVFKILNNNFPLDERKFLNVNIPPIKADECNGIKVTKAGLESMEMILIDIKSKRWKYYWIGLHPLIWKPSENKIVTLKQ